MFPPEQRLINFGVSKTADMKKGIIFLVTAVCLLTASSPSEAQGFLGLHVISMPGYPALPADTAFEGISYNFDIFIYNGSNVTINNTIVVNLRVDTVSTVIASSPALPPLGPGDTIIVTVSQYNFDPSQYKAGNNIVVVWPAVNGMSVPVDTTFKDVYFVPLNSLSSHDLKNPDFHIYPVPVRDELYLEGLAEQDLEYVRIFDASGRLATAIKPGIHRPFDLSFLKPGFYVIEVKGRDICGRIRFIKL